MFLTLNDKEYYVPQKWTEVSLGSYQAFMEKTGEDLDDHTNNMFAISTLTGAPFVELEKCKKSEVDAVIEALDSLLNTTINSTLNLLITIGDQQYGFHPNLKEITFAEFVDLDNYLENPIENMHRIMGVLYREVTNEKKGKYDIVEYDSSQSLINADLFKESLSIATVNGAAAFFLNIGREYNIVLQSYSRIMKKKKTTEIQDNSLAKSGDGTR